ncbi:MAG: hypothetical protein WBA76_00595 [Phormidesmis sp.]
MPNPISNQVLPVRQSVLGLGLRLGFSGIFGLLCMPALAALAATNNTQGSANKAIPAAPEHISKLFYEPASPELTYAIHQKQGLSNKPVQKAERTQLNTQLNERDSPLSTQPLMASARLASAHALHSTVSLPPDNSQYSDHYTDHRVTVENNHRPRFALLCQQSACHTNRITQNQKKVISDESAATAAALVRLLSHPAASHVSQAEIPDEVVAAGTTISQVPDFVDALPGGKLPQIRSSVANQPDGELGDLRLQLKRSRPTEDLGILRLLQTAQAPPSPPKQPIAFISGRLGFFDTDNVFRSARTRLDDQIYQAGIGAYFFPELSKNTNLYAIAETSLARYEKNPTFKDQTINYNQVELQLGLRQRLADRTYAQIGLRNQQLYSPGYREKVFGANYIDAQINHRSILSSRAWLDGFYEVELGFAQSERDEDNRDAASRLRQTLTLSLNYAATKDLRTSLIYQLDLDDYTQTARYDTYQQVLGVVSYSLTPESRLSLFGGTRFGRSSSANVNLDDTFYGAGLNVVVPFF